MANGCHRQTRHIMRKIICIVKIALNSEKERKVKINLSSVFPMTPRGKEVEIDWVTLPAPPGCSFLLPLFPVLAQVLPWATGASLLQLRCCLREDLCSGPGAPPALLLLQTPSVGSLCSCSLLGCQGHITTIAEHLSCSQWGSWPLLGRWVPLPATTHCWRCVPGQPPHRSLPNTRSKVQWKWGTQSTLWSGRSGRVCRNGLELASNLCQMISEAHLSHPRSLRIAVSLYVETRICSLHLVSQQKLTGTIKNWGPYKSLCSLYFFLSPELLLPCPVQKKHSGTSPALCMLVRWGLKVFTKY